MIISLFFILGAIYGSFLNMLLWRLPRRETIRGRSYCPSCRHQLAWYDLIPIISYIILKGRCRYCRSGIPFRYLAVELVCAFVLLGFALLTTPTTATTAVFGAFIVLILLGLLFFDLFYFILPDVFIFPAIIITGFYDILAVTDPWGHLITAFLASLFFAILYLASKGRWLGLGDVKLVFLLGLIFGFPMTFWVITAAIWLGAIIGLAMVFSGAATMKKALPLGSFLAATSLAALIFQNKLTFLLNFFQ